MTNRQPSSPVAVCHLAFGLVAAAAAPGATVAHAAEPYKLSAADLKLDCKQLTGTIKVRLTALRQKPVAPTSAVSRGLQSVSAPIFGGTSYGADEAAQRGTDLSLVEAYNKRLVEKNCPSFDIPAALAPAASTSPRPTIPAKPKPAVSK